MKKIICILLATIFIFTFAACADKNENNDESTVASTVTTTAEAKSTTLPEEKPTQSDDGEIYYTEVLGEGEYINDIEEKITYKFTVCKIKSDVPGADEFNTQIDDFLVPMAETQLEIIENGEYASYNVMSAEVYYFEGIYTMLYCYGYSMSLPEYVTYHFDSVNGKTLSDAEFLNAIGTSYEEFLQKANEAAEEYLINNPEGFEDSQKAIATTKHNIGQYPVKPFVCDGNVCATVPVAYVTEDSYRNKELILALAPATPAIPVDEAMEKLGNNEDVKELMEMGMTMVAENNVQKIAGQMCQLISIGTDHESHFVSEYLFGVSNECIYLYDVAGDAWNYYG